MNENLTEDELENWVDDRNMNWIHVMDKRSRRIHKMFKVNSWPTMYLINPKGKVIKLRDELRGKGLISTLESVL